MAQEDLHEELQAIYKEGEEATQTSHHEEYFITDWECDYKDIGEYDSMEELNDLAEQMEQLDEDEQTAVKLILDNGISKTIEEAQANLENIYNTGQTSMEDVAIEYVNSTNGLDGMADNLTYYFDYEALGRDMDIDGTYLEDEEGYIWEYIE